MTDASQAVRSPLAYATIITLLTIVPIAVMEGRPGAFFEPLAIAYALAVVAAMVVALTLTPALSALLFAKGSPGGESPIVSSLRDRYDSVLSRAIGAHRGVLIAAGVCVLAAAIIIPVMGTSLVPSFKDRNVLVRLDAEPGTSNPRMTEIATQVSRQLRGLPGVDNVGAHVGAQLAPTSAPTSTGARST